MLTFSQCSHRNNATLPGSVTLSIVVTYAIGLSHLTQRGGIAPPAGGAGSLVIEQCCFFWRELARVSQPPVPGMPNR
jgi:hypothetical protein